MSRVTKIENTSDQDIKVKLTGGPDVTLPPRATLENADVENIDALKGQVKVTENLTEVGLPSGCQRIDG